MIKNNAQLIANVIINWPKKDRRNLTSQIIINKFKEKYPERVKPI